MSTAHFLSTRNYLKRDATASEPLQVAGPSVSEFFGLLYTTRIQVPHDLGYVPMFRCYYEPFGNGMIYPIISLPLQGRANNPTGSGASFGPGLLYWADNVNIYIMLYYDDNSLASERFPVYLTTYIDFAIG